jgi:hypothetical protein
MSIGQNVQLSKEIRIFDPAAIDHGLHRGRSVLRVSCIVNIAAHRQRSIHAALLTIPCSTLACGLRSSLTLRLISLQTDTSLESWVRQ